MLPGHHDVLFFLKVGFIQFHEFRKQYLQFVEIAIFNGIGDGLFMAQEFLVEVVQTLIGHDSFFVFVKDFYQSTLGVR